MKFHETELQGAYVIELEKLEDSRGFFVRAWCQKEFEDTGLVSRVVQINNSCSGACTFCSTVLIKGKLQTYDEPKILQDVSTGVKEGCGEFWLTSMDTASSQTLARRRASPPQE